jgi:hypothetical protein
VDNWQAANLAFFLWKMWKTFPQKMWKSGTYRSFTAKMWKSPPAKKTMTAYFAHFPGLFHISGPVFHCDPLAVWGKIPTMYTQSVENVEKLSTLCVDNSWICL